MEIVEVSSQTVSDRGRTRENQLTLSPGVRRAWNLTEKQIVVGAAVPVTFAGGGTSVALLGYFSYEARFKK